MALQLFTSELYCFGKNWVQKHEYPLMMRLFLKLKDVLSSLGKGIRVSFYIFSYAGCIKLSREVV